MSGETLVPGLEGVLYSDPDRVLLGRCYDKVEQRADGLWEGVGGIVAGPVVYRARDEYGPALVSCESCDEYVELPYLDDDVARRHGREWALAHRCETSGVDVR